jgi:hypothetical protein
MSVSGVIGKGRHNFASDQSKSTADLSIANCEISRALELAFHILLEQEFRVAFHPL